MKPHSKLILALMMGSLLAGCGKKPEEKKPAGPPPALITVSKAAERDVIVAEQSVGEADSATAPRVAAEVAGRIQRVHVEIGDTVKKGQVLATLDAQDYVTARNSASADVKRLQALAENQDRLTARYRDLVQKNFISPVKMEETESMNVASREQLLAAKSQLDRASNNLSRTRIIAPVAGRIEQRLVSEGDWIDAGKPTFQIATSDALRVRLPFPENVSSRIKAGLEVRLTTPTAPGKSVTGRIEQMRPSVGGGSRSLDAIVEVKNPGDWRPGASVNGEVVLETHAAAVTVPESSVVLRPAGLVVYVIAEGKAAQRIVKTGVRREGYVEITEGLKAGETIALDGAGFLTDKAAVTVKEPTAAPPKK